MLDCQLVIEGSLVSGMHDFEIRLDALTLALSQARNSHPIGRSLI